MQLINKFNKGSRFWSFAFDSYSRYSWVIPLKDKKRITITITFQKIVNESKREPNKTWVDKRSEFCNRSMKPWLEKYDLEMYPTYNEGKPVITQRFIRTLKNKIYKYMNSL